MSVSASRILEIALMDSSYFVGPFHTAESQQQSTLELLAKFFLQRYLVLDQYATDE